MISSHPLDKIIRRMESDWLPTQLEPEERLMIFDVGAGKILAKKPLFSLGRDIRYYLVSTRRRPVECEGLVCRVKSASTRLSIDIAVRYEARCDKGNEEKLVAALVRGGRTAAMVDRFIADRVEDFVAGESAATRDVCLEFLQLRGALQVYIADRVRNELGLTLDVLARPLIENELKVIVVKTDYFPVRVCDHDDPVELKITTDLEIDSANSMRAVLFHHREAELEESIRQVVRQVLAEQVTLHSFTFELTTKVRRHLIEAINARLTHEGRRIAYLQLESRTNTNRAAGIGEIEYSVSCRIADCEAPIDIRHRLKLSLCDFGRFRSSGIEDLEAWVTARLDDITRDVLFERRYLDLLLAFRPDEIEIKTRIEREVGEVGYTVKQLITAPALEPLRWKEGFLIENLSDTFATRDSRIDVGLNIVVKGKITDLRNPNLQKYLTPRSRLFGDLRGAVLRETRQIIHGVSPEHFYMRFAYSDDANTPAVRETLEKQIGELLAERFAVEDIGVIAKPLETELTKRLEYLQRGPHKVDITCSPLNRGGEEVQYRIDFDILGVPPDGWYAFRAKSYGSPKKEHGKIRQAISKNDETIGEIPQVLFENLLEEPEVEKAIVENAEKELQRIREVIAEDVKTKLQVAPRDILQFTDLGRYRDLMQVIQQSLRGKVEMVFGLRIHIVNINRLATHGEQKGNEAVKHAIDTSMETGKEILSRKQADLHMLYAKRSEMIASDMGSDDPIFADLEQRIRTLEEEVSPDQFARGQQEVKALLPGRRGNSRSEEWKRLALGEEPTEQPSEPPRLTESVEEEAP